jgi:hypothetical protein
MPANADGDAQAASASGGGASVDGSAPEDLQAARSE